MLSRCGLNLASHKTDMKKTRCMMELDREDWVELIDAEDELVGDATEL